MLNEGSETKQGKLIIYLKSGNPYIMRELLAPMEELADFDNMKKYAAGGKPIPGGVFALSGCVDSQKLHMIYSLSRELDYTVIVTYSDIRARQMADEYEFYDKNVAYYPAKDLIFFQADIHGNKLTRDRITLLKRLYSGEPFTIVTTFAALMNPQYMWNAERDIISIKRNDTVDLSALTKRLAEIGYEREYQVEAPGQFSVRGGILDIFDISEDNPYRIELWGDDVDSVRSFDILSQRSVEELDGIDIYPATEYILSREQIDKGLSAIKKESALTEKRFRDEHKPEEAHRIKETVKEFAENLTEFGNRANVEAFMNYFSEEKKSLAEFIRELSNKTCFFIDEPMHVTEEARAVEKEFDESMYNRILKGYILPKQADIILKGEDVAAKLMKSPVVSLSTLEGRGGFFPVGDKADISARNAPSYNSSFDALVKDLKQYKKKKSRVLLLSSSRSRAERIARDLREEEINAVYTENTDREVMPGEVLLYYGSIKKGFEYPLLKFVVLTESDVFGKIKNKKKKYKSFAGEKINDFNELKVGDYVVHISHGLGVFKGIEKVEMEGIVKDYLKVEYRDGGSLYVPATGLDVVHKYASADTDKKPKLNKLGTKEWDNTKAKVKSAVDEVAKDLVELYAKRQQDKGFVYGKDTVWQKEFEEQFPFEETKDQLQAIEDTKADMESDRIMDRLICGDVGYGKTEIAIRAAFKAVQENKQVVYLVPTTILAQQHYATFIQRMKDFPVKVELLSRFRTSKEIKSTIEGLKSGMVDIVIGTHRVLSEDVKFKDLGLLIIDEEQRFGVSHKEKIKKLKENVDVLTLTATPIPRTLHMSLTGIRDMSMLEEAPEDRLPIQTFVCEYDEEMVREAISRELSRGGQVYYVYNRVNTIADIARKVEELVPEATVAFAHGQMQERELERIMYDFVNGEIDVLVSTTIIETGMDIPNVNTLIIHDSDNLGLSQLYQLRGRVGRSSRNAYAFLMYKRDKMLKETAEKRLEAIREFTELGSGFKIAMRDLEIRGAGNLLGRRQHGHMEAVGYDMYVKMLSEAVSGLKGVPLKTDFLTAIDLDVDAFIPPEYIVNEIQKLDIYKKISGIENESQREDMKDELIDRFGKIPKSVDNLLRIALMRQRAHELYYTEIKGKNGRLTFTFKNDAGVDPAGIPALLKLYGDTLSFSANGKVPVFTYRYRQTGMVEKDEELLMDITEKLLLDMSEKLLTGTG